MFIIYIIYIAKHQYAAILSWNSNIIFAALTADTGVTMKSNIMFKTAHFSLLALIILTMLSQKGHAIQIQGGSDRGGGDASVMQANITAAHKKNLYLQLESIFSNADHGVISIKNYLLYFFKKIDLVKSNEAHKTLSDMRSRGVEALIQNKLLYKVSSVCLDKNKQSKAATADITANPPLNPEVCINPDKIISDLGTNITDSALIGIVAHELSHFYGYEDIDHSLAAAAAETMRTLSREEDRTLVQLEAAQLSDRTRLTRMPKTNCDIPIETNMTSSPCNPIEWAQLVNYKDFYVDGTLSVLTRQVTISPVQLAGGQYSRKKIQLGSAVSFSYSTGQQLNVARQEKIKIIKITNPTLGAVMGEIEIEVYPELDKVDSYGIYWENTYTGEVYDYAKRKRYYELVQKFNQNSDAILNVDQLIENTAYKFKVRIIGQDFYTNILSTSEYMTYFNVRNEFAPPVDYVGFASPNNLAIQNKLAPEVDLNLYEKYLTEALLDYRQACSEYICDGNVQNRSIPQLLMAKDNVTNVKMNGVDRVKMQMSRVNLKIRTIVTQQDKALLNNKDISSSEKTTLLIAYREYLGLLNKLDEQYIKIYGNPQTDQGERVNIIRQIKLLELELKT